MRSLASGLSWTAFLLSFLPHLPHSTDDAFITHRCAWNLAIGHGLVFNPGEIHLATTAPGFAILVGGIGGFLTPAAIPYVAGTVSLLSLAGAAMVLAWCFAPPLRLTLPLLLCFIAASRWLVEILGHETPAQAFLLLSSLAALDRERPLAAGALLALATAVRPDSAVFGAVIGLHRWVTSRRLPLRLALGYALPLPVLLAGIYGFAGTLVPASLAVKRAEASVPLLAFDHTYVSSLVAWFERDYGLVGAVALLGLAIVGMVASHTRLTERFWGLALLVGGAVAFYPLAGVTFAPWYFVIPLLAISFWGSLTLTRTLEERRWAPAIVAVTATVLAFSSSLPWLVANGSAPPDPRMKPNRAVAQWIHEHSGPTDSVAAVEVGFLAYFADRPVVDLIGLGSAGALEALVGGRVADYFFMRAPTFLVRHPVFDYVQGPVLADPRFGEAYVLERSFAEPPGGPVIELYRRRDS